MEWFGPAATGVEFAFDLEVPEVEAGVERAVEDVGSRKATERNRVDSILILEEEGRKERM